jgi:F0F1-type ATP synthase assembly protein I
MIEPGRGMAYLALFSQIGITLLVTTLVGVLGGYWLDGQIGTKPVLAILGFFAGAGLGAWADYRLVSRFLATIK